MKFPAMLKLPEAHLDDRTPCGRVNLTEREACERVCDFEAVENCMTEKEAKQEQADVFAVIISDTVYLREAERHYGKSYN